jgi:hypothetical protein
MQVDQWTSHPAAWARRRVSKLGQLDFTRVKTRSCGVPKSKKRNSKNSMRAALPENPPKALVYEALAGFNRNFEQVLQDLERLATLDLFTERWQRRAFKACRATLEEMRASANFEVIEVLHLTEEREWTRLGRRRRRLENLPASSDDVSVPTKSIMRKSAR